MTEAQKAANEFTGGFIIAASPVREEQGCNPARIVIREFEDKYTVHMQVFQRNDDGSFTSYYIWGTYIPRTDPNAFADAWGFFEARSRHLHSLPAIGSDRRNPATV
jgi:hypothetical protein